MDTTELVHYFHNAIALLHQNANEDAVLNQSIEALQRLPPDLNPVQRVHFYQQVLSLAIQQNTNMFTSQEQRINQAVVRVGRFNEYRFFGN